MAQTMREPGTQIENSVKESPWEWNFFMLTRELDRYFGKQDPNMERIGFSYGIENEPVQFRQKPTLAFPPSDVAEYTPSNSAAIAQLAVHCFGLLGCNGPMPLFLTEYVFERTCQHKDDALKDFLDIFHHRMISLYYRAWAVNQIAVNREWKEDPFSDYIGSLINLKKTIGSDTTLQGEKIPNDARLYYSGRLIQKDMNVEGICAVLSGYFNTKVSMEQFTGQWITIPHSDQCRLGESEETGLVGKTCIIGKRIFDINQKFRLIIGPMPLDLYKKLVPGEKGFSHLRSWVDNYVGMSFDWDIQLILKAEEVPDFKANKQIRLGYTSWLKKRKGQEAADNLIISGNR